jgi:hypothetical protein
MVERVKVIYNETEPPRNIEAMTELEINELIS